MKNIILLVLIGLTLASCRKTEESDVICDTVLNCQDEDCLFTLDNTSGTTTFLSCFDRWAINVPAANNGDSWYIVDDWDASYEEESIKVLFCGYVRENSLPLILPDPIGGRMYQIKLENIEVQNQ